NHKPIPRGIPRDSLPGKQALALSGGSAIDEPDQVADGPDAGCRHLAAASADRPEDRGLFLARHQERDPPAALDRRIGHGDADLGPAMGDGGDPAFALLQYRFTRQKRGGMAIGAKPEQGDIEQRSPRIQPSATLAFLPSP